MDVSATQPDVVRTGSVTFDFSGAHGDLDVVERTGKLFEAGDYADKDFSLSEEEMEQAIATFQSEPDGVPLDIEHGPSLFDGKLGRLVDVWRDGPSLMGRAEMPRWLADALAGTPLRVSTSWDRATKALRGLALVRDPAVPDAVLMSAYARFAGRRHSAEDAADMQAIHDITTRQGAQCQGATSSRSWMNASGDRRSRTGDSRSVLPVGARKLKGDKRMSFKDTLAAWFSAGMPDDFDDTEQATGQGRGATEPRHGPPAGQQTVTAPMVGGGTIMHTMASSGTGPTVPADPLLAELQERVRQQDQQLAQLRSERITREAQAATDGLISAGKALPAEREGLLAAFEQAARDDADRGPVVFSGGQSTSRVQQLAAAFSARPAHQLRSELLPPHTSVLAGGPHPHPRGSSAGQQDTDLQAVYDAAKGWAEKANGQPKRQREGGVS